MSMSLKDLPYVEQHDPVNDWHNERARREPRISRMINPHHRAYSEWSREELEFYINCSKRVLALMSGGDLQKLAQDIADAQNALEGKTK